MKRRSLRLNQNFFAAAVVEKKIWPPLARVMNRNFFRPRVGWQSIILKKEAPEGLPLEGIRGDVIKLFQKGGGWAKII